MQNLSERYAGQIITTDPNYPYGRARNVSEPGHGDGTPWDQDMASDLHGAMQAIVVRGGLPTITGNPENVNESDVVAALDAAYTAKEDFNDAATAYVCNAYLSNNNIPIGDSTLFIMSLGTRYPAAAGWGLNGFSGVFVPKPGLWRVDVRVQLTMDYEGTGVRARIEICNGSTPYGEARSERKEVSADGTSVKLFVSGFAVIPIDNIGSDYISLINRSGVDVQSDAVIGGENIERKHQVMITYMGKLAAA